MLRFAVRDTGIGISEMQRRHLFESFQQADSSTTRKYGGTGLGLAICKRLIHLMGGEIGIDSAPGQGSTFSFSVRLGIGTPHRQGCSIPPDLHGLRSPVVDDNEQIQCADPVLQPFDPADRVDVAQARPASSADLLTPNEALRGALALLVEDNELNQEVATEFLQALGLEVNLAANGEIALAKVGQQRYDIVLMDMQMPVMDGITATQAMRQRPELRDLPIVAMTANAMAGDRERCIAAGMNDHIAKPIAPDDLVRKLEKWIRPELRRARAPGVATANPVHPPEATAATHASCLKWQAIEGLDSARGLRQALGREALYLNLLKQFVAAEQDAPARIAQALAAARTEDAKRVAHTLKGVAAQIGAGPMSQLAAALEQAIHEGAGAALLNPLQGALAEQLPRLIQAIAAQLPTDARPPNTANAPAAPTHADASLRERLTALLEDDDATSVSFVEAHEEPLRMLLGERFGPLAQAISQFDLPAALQVLQARSKAPSD